MREYNRYTRKARFAYEGPAVNSGVIDTEDLDSALMGFTELAKEAYKITGGKGNLRVFVDTESLQDGSIEILPLIQVALDGAKNAVEYSNQAGIGDVMQLLSWAVTGVEAVELGIKGYKASKRFAGNIFTLVKMLHGKLFRSKEEDVDGHKLILIELPGGEKIYTSPQVLEIYKDPKCRKALRKILRPLRKKGIDHFVVRNPDAPGDKTPLILLDKEDAELFEDVLKAERYADHHIHYGYQEMVLTIVSLSFDRTASWKFEYEDMRINAKIRDRGFWMRLNNPEERLSFRPGDQLKVLMAVYPSKNGHNFSFSVEKVLELKQ